MSARSPEVMPKSNGHLLCDFHNTYWCIDIEEMVKSGSDAELVWMNYPDPMQLEVPIIPSSNLWTTVLLTKPENARSTMYRVEFFQTVGTEGVFIGFLHPSEGRNVLRMMILDWFSGTQAPEKLICQSRGHGYSQNQRLVHDMKYPALWIAQQWSMWRTGKCLGCTFDANDNKDLVPDDARPTWNPGGPV